MKSKIVIALTIFAFVSCGKKTGGNTGAPEYVVETVTTTSTEQSTSYPATIKGKQDIEIRPKVSGFITNYALTKVVWYAKDKHCSLSTVFNMKPRLKAHALQLMWQKQP